MKARTALHLLIACVSRQKLTQRSCTTVSATVFALRKPLVDLQATERFSTARPQRSKRPPKTATRHMYHKYLQHIYKYILNKPL